MRLKRSIFTLFLILSTLSLGLFLPSMALATDSTPGNDLDAFCSSINNLDSSLCKKKDANANDLIPKVLNILMFIVFVLSVGFIIYGGIVYSTSSGKPDNIRKAKKVITGAVIGLVVSILALAIVRFTSLVANSAVTGGSSEEGSGD